MNGSASVRRTTDATLSSVPIANGTKPSANAMTVTSRSVRTNESAIAAAPTRA